MKINLAKKNYITGELKMLAIVKYAKEWKHYLKRTVHPIGVITDYCNLQSSLTIKILSKKSSIVRTII